MLVLLTLIQSVKLLTPQQPICNERGRGERGGREGVEKMELDRERRERERERG